VRVNVGLFTGMLLAAAGLLRVSGSYPEASFVDLVVDGLHMSRLERVVQDGDGLIPAVLTFVLPALTVLILGEGAVRVFAAYLKRGRHREEWDLMVARTFSGHAVICGIGELGRALIKQLLAVDPDAHIVVVDPRPGILAELGYSGQNACHIQADMTSRATLEAANCDEARLILLTSGNDAFNLEAGLKVSQMNPRAGIWVRLYRSGLADLMSESTRCNVRFFCPYDEAAETLVSHLLTPDAPRNVPVARPS
jgi:voltage-gated potassium channel Kch